MTASKRRGGAGSPRTSPGSPRCAPTPRRGPHGAGRSRAPTAWVGHWPSASSRPANSWSTFPRSSPRGSRLFDTGHNRKADAHDAHSIAMVAVRTSGLRELTLDPDLEAVRMLVERREALSRRRVQTVDRLQALLAELRPGQAKKNTTTCQAKRMLAAIRPRDVAGKTRRRRRADVTRVRMPHVSGRQPYGSGGR